MTSQLARYNGALRELGEEQLSALTDDVEARRYLDGVWDDNAINYWLERGLWYFAMRTAKFDPDPSLTPNFGYRNAYAKPADWVRTAMLCLDEYFNVPLTQVRDESGMWYSDANPIYVQFVSNDAEYGGNLARWPMTFCRYVDVDLAKAIAPKLTSGGPERVADLEKLVRQRLLEAKSAAAMNESASFPPTGTWVRARFGRNSSWDRGNRGQLIGG